MNKILRLCLCFIVSLLALNANAQTEDSSVYIAANGRTYTQVFDSLASGLIHSRIPYGVLYDRVFPWSVATSWQDGDTTSMYRLFQTWWDMEQSRLDSLAPRHYGEMRLAAEGERLAGRVPLLFISYNLRKLTLPRCAMAG